LVSSDLPVTVQNMSAVVDRATQKIVLSYVNSISTLYKTEFYGYNGSTFGQGYEVPPSATPISLSTLKFPVSASYNLSAVGAWCSLSITDMTTYSGSWDVNAICLRTGTNGDDLYSLEIVQPNTAVALTSVPNPPTNVLTGLYPNGIGLSFTPPIVTGGYISGYEVFATSNGGVSYYTKTGFSSPIIVPGLTPGTTYTVTMKAKNAKGQSAAVSGTPASIVYKILPDPPTAIVGSMYPVGNATGINVAFTNPVNTGGGVDLYYASALDITSTQNTISSSNAVSPVFLSSGLVPGTTYRFTVYSQNAAGSSVVSTSVGTLLYQVPPSSAPTITSLALTPAGNPIGILVGFTPPTNTGGGITDYITNLYNGNLGIGAATSTIGTSSPIIVSTGLTPGNAYSFRVTGRNSGGTGPLSVYSTIVYKTLPGAPTLTGLSLYPSGNPFGIQVSFSPPSNLGGGIDTYTAFLYSSSVLIASTSNVVSPIIFTGLTPGSFYNTNVVAINAGGTSATSVGSTIQYKTLPNPPTNVTGVLYPPNNATGINVSFNYPSYTGGGVEQYVASAIDISGTASTVTVQGTNSTLFLSAGLVIGKTYQFTVYSQNAAGNSIPSTSASSLIFQNIAGPPTGVTTVLTPAGNPSGVSVSFTPPAFTGGGTINGYTATAYSSVVAIASATGASSPIVVSTLTPGVTYNFVVTAINAAGSSQGSLSSLITYKTLPTVPTNVFGSLSPVGAAKGINVSFTYPSNLGGGVDTYYALAYDTLGIQSTVLVSNTNSPVFISTSAGIVPGTTYSFGVYAKNAGGTTGSTLSGTSLLYQIPPSAPLSLTTVLTPTENPYGITASFSIPSNLGGGINSYTISVFSGATFIASQTGTAFSYLFSTPTTSLVPGTTYNFYANAVNTGGSGASSITSAIVYKTLPDAPTNVAGALYPVGAGTGINITFSYPANLGGGVDLYYAMAIDTAATASTVLSTSATSPIFINTAMGLIPGTTYKFAVFSKNAGGSSGSTISGTTLFYQTLPTAPTITATLLDPPANPTGVMVSFNAPSNTFGGITNYTANAYTGTTLVASSIGTVSPIKISSLTAGTSYNYTVAAINTAGIGVSSIYTTLVYYTQPGLVTGVSVALQPPANPTGVNVSFTPGATGGGALTYTARAYTGTTVTSSGSNTVSPVYITSLTPGTSYNFTVTAANVAVSGLSTTSVAYTYYTNPSLPQSITSTVGYSIGSQKAYISWTAPATTGGSAITSYTITSNPAAYSNTVGSGTTNVTTTAVLTNGTGYTFTVVATNGAGLTSSATSGSATPYGLAGQTTGLSVSSGVNQLYLSWSAAAANGKTITNYKISQTGGSANTYTLGNVLSYTVTGLATQTSYTFTVAATNDGTNYGTSSNSASATTYNVPSAPNNVSASRNGNVGQLTLSWTAPSNDGGTGITAYYISNGGGYFAANTPYTFTGLSNNTNYTLYVYAVNGAGSGPVASSSNRTYSAPFNLSMTQIYQDWNNFSLSWSADGDGLTITKYLYYFNNGGWVDFGTGTALNFSGLAAGTTYAVYLQAVNAVGTTQAGPFNFATSGSIPPAPTGVYYEWYDNNYNTVGFNLHWNAVSAYPAVTQYYWHVWWTGIDGSWHNWETYTTGLQSGWYYTDTSPRAVYWNVYAISAAGWGVVAKNY
jgi:titin